MIAKRLLLTAILLGQILVESLLCFFVGTDYYNSSFYITMRALHIGLIPAIFIFSTNKDYILKFLSLTLIIQCSLKLLLEVIASNSEYGYLALKLTHYDYYNFTLIITSIVLSLLFNGLSNRFVHLYIYLLALLRKTK